MHSRSLYQTAVTLIDRGVNDCEIARRLGIPRTTVRDWRHHPRQHDLCWRCWHATRPVRFQPSDYTELLGLYLGDGHITLLPRTQRLRVFLDSRHTAIVDETEALLHRCFPGNRVCRVRPRGKRMVILTLHHAHLLCVLPQHGPGKKHDRSIELEAWQRQLVGAAPWGFIKGCIRSDGCVFINRTGRYEYLSYCFDNHSSDIRALFVEACRQVGVECRPAGTSVRIYRRASVASMLRHVGTKH